MFGPLTADQTRAFGNALEAVVERLDPDRSLRVEHGSDVADEGGQSRAG
jgi:hypothetical protein